jgi:hypothetical protein
VLLGLRLNKMALQTGKHRLSLRQRQAQRCGRAFGSRDASGVNLMNLSGASYT